jgi:lipopolysaccharide export system protein LptA
VQKLRLFFLLILVPCALFAQKKTKITLLNSQHNTIDLKTNTSYLRKPVFKQDNAILSCDSAVFYEARNVFEAFRNVHINQADTVNIYSDRLTYDGNSKMAHLTSNVRLVDRESVLTTNVLDYNMGAKIGTYVDGGKIVSKDVTLTSKNGYYFSNSRDAYFRYNVVVVTPEVTIKSDTLRYNTLSNWTYFYGPTNIKGKDDNLYTENGAYNTKSEYAYFGKKNLYTQGSKSLKGDSLYYDGIAGYGKAVRNIVFVDTTDKTVLYGQLGYFYKADQRTVVTRNAYIGMGTKDSIKVQEVMRPDTLWLGADTLETQMVLRQTLTLLPRTYIQKDNEVGSEDVDSTGVVKEKRVKVNDLPPAARTSAVNTTGANKAAADKSAGKKSARQRKKDAKRKAEEPAGSASAVLNTDSLNTDSLKTSAIVQADSIHKAPPDSLASVKKGEVAKDSVVKAVKGKVAATGKTLVAAKDSTKLKPAKILNPLDTVKARIIKAYHNVRVYKSNLQARSDSLFYTSADSTLRWYNKPIMWAEGSQQTGDTIYLQLKNNKLDAVQVFQTAFSVNVEKDSTRFNQVKGKKMTGFFKDGKVNSMYVDGNAESVYFTKDDKGAYKEMNQTVSSRLKITFTNDEIADLVTIRDAESAITPIAQLKENVLLTGFIWKPELRPSSKRDVTNPKKVVKAPSKAVLKAGAKSPTKALSGVASGKALGAAASASGKAAGITSGKAAVAAQKAGGSAKKGVQAIKAAAANTKEVDSVKKVVAGAVESAESTAPASTLSVSPAPADSSSTTRLPGPTSSAPASSAPTSTDSTQAAEGAEIPMEKGGAMKQETGTIRVAEQDRTGTAQKPAVKK